MYHSIVYNFPKSKINNLESKNVFNPVIEYLCAVYESPKTYLEISYSIKRVPKNIHINSRFITDTNTKKLKKGIRIRIQKNFRTDTDSD